MISIYFKALFNKNFNYYYYYLHFLYRIGFVHASFNIFESSYDFLATIVRLASCKTRSMQHFWFLPKKFYFLFFCVFFFCFVLSILFFFFLVCLFTYFLWLWHSFFATPFIRLPTLIHVPVQVRVKGPAASATSSSPLWDSTRDHISNLFPLLEKSQPIKHSLRWLCSILIYVFFSSLPPIPYPWDGKFWKHKKWKKKKTSTVQIFGSSSDLRVNTVPLNSTFCLSIFHLWSQIQNPTPIWLTHTNTYRGKSRFLIKSLMFI